MTASVMTAKASLISMRSTSPSVQPARLSACLTAGTGLRQEIGHRLPRDQRGERIIPIPRRNVRSLAAGFASFNVNELGLTAQRAALVLALRKASRWRKLATSRCGSMRAATRYVLT
jgi:hypothetical protein